jgi:hypothetical protein
LICDAVAAQYISEGFNSELSDISIFLKPFVEPWYQSIANPVQTQETLLPRLVQGYEKTDYGEKHGAGDAATIRDFQTSFPITNYRDLTPYLDQVKNSRYSVLLPEPVVCWVMTRGTTGTPKFIPTTETHLSQIRSIGARAIINFALRTGSFDVLQGAVLNLNFPSQVGALRTPEGESVYGYSSGTYARLNPGLGSARLVPQQEEIDALGGGVTKKDWANRFELVYQRAKDAEIKSVMGVAPVITSFARYVKKRHHQLPKNLWRLQGFFCTSVAKIQTNYAPRLRYLYGEAPMVEMYTATEGVFAQQLDDKPYVCPNYDAYLFEVKTGNGVKMLHEMKPGEWGRIIISSTLFPRYDIGDLVEAMGKGYFRIFGRATRLVTLEHILFNIAAGRFL